MIANFQSLTKKETTGFDIKPYADRPYEFDDRVHLSIAYELDPDFYHVDMQVYNALDMLGDIGGL